MALAIGFTNRLARRMPHHNGYRTLGAESTALAQLHPSCARVVTDEDGLLPEWVVYHELIATGRVFLSKVSQQITAWHARPATRDAIAAVLLRDDEALPERLNTHKAVLR